jgi:hypothetical protein
MSEPKGPMFDRIIIILIALGVVILGAKDLSYLRNGLSLQQVSQVGGRPVFSELQEDLSTAFSDGVPVEQLTAQTDKDLRARYPFTFQRDSDQFAIKSEDRGDEEKLSLVARLKRLFGK